MIYLWVEGEGWKEFEISNTPELEKRGITIESEAEIGSRAVISSGAEIGSRAVISSGAVIGSRAVISSGATPKIVYIIGSRFPVSYWEEDRIDIGCQSRSIDQWLNDYADIASEHDFSPAEIDEYRCYVEFIKSIHNRKTS
jgi:NDP-sugar pyrophosphorylase family protein